MTEGKTIAIPGIKNKLSIPVAAPELTLDDPRRRRATESALREVSIATQVIPGRCTASSDDEHDRTPDATDRAHGLVGVPRYRVASRRGADLGP